MLQKLPASQTGQLDTTVGDTSVKITYSYNPNEAVHNIPLVYIRGRERVQLSFATAISESPRIANRKRVAFRVPRIEKPVSESDISSNLGKLIEVTHDLVTTQYLGEFVLAGYNLGGAVAALYAQKYPNKVAGLIKILGNIGTYTQKTPWDNPSTYTEHAALATRPFDRQHRIIDTLGHFAGPCAFVYGKDVCPSNDYLDVLDKNQVSTFEIPENSPLDNAKGYFEVVADFMKGLDEGQPL